MDRTLLKFKFEAFKRKVKEVIDKVTDMLKNALAYMVDFAKEHPLEFATMLLAAAGGGMKLINRHDRKQAAKAESLKRDRQIYDRSEGHYWTLKRTPRPEEWGEINYRHRQGESYYHILTQMRLI